MPKIFVDCGFYKGGILKYYRDWGIVDKDWVIHAFEPNPNLDCEKAVKELDLPIQIIPRAVGTNDGTVRLSLAGREDAARVDAAGEHEVVSIDFSKYIARLPKVDICSMDIEGNEFPVLEKLLEDGTINKIKLLDVEFHHRLDNPYTLEDAENLLQRIKDCDVQIRLKVPLQ